MGGAFDARAFNNKAFYVGVLSTASHIVFATVAALGTPQPLTAQTGAAVGTTATLRTASRLVAAAEIHVSAAGDFSTFTGVRAVAAWTIAVTPPRLTASEISLTNRRAAFYEVAFYQPAFGQTFSNMMVSAAGTLRAPIVFRSQPRITVGSAAPFLQLPANLTARAEIPFETQAIFVFTGPSGTAAIIRINGQPRTARVGSVTIRDVVNEATNSLDLIIDDPLVPPAAGNDIQIGLGSVLPNRLIFAGVIQSVEQSYVLEAANPCWHVRATDYGVLLNRRQLWASYEHVSATTIARDLIQTYSSGFTMTHIAAGLPPITVSVTGVTLSAALSAVANAIGGYWYVDYSKDVHLFVTESDPATDPAPIDGVTEPRHLADAPIALRTDHTQIRTRILVVGISVGLRAPARAGDTVIAIDDAQPFAGPGGLALLRDGSRLTYGGTAPGDASAIIRGSIQTPTGPPFPALATDVAGYLAGWYQWAVAFGTAAGETLVGPLSGPLFAPTVEPPTSGPGIGPAGAGPLVGPYTYRIAFVTSVGETLLGPPVSRTASAVVAGGLSLAIGPAAISRLTPGLYSWVVTYLTALGETTAGPAASATLTDLAPPGVCTVGTAAAPGVLPPGVSVGYRVTFVSQDGETTAGGVTEYTPPGMAGPALFSWFSQSFGGLYSGPYSYAVSIVTPAGESGLTGSLATGTGHFTTGPTTQPNWTGGQQDARTNPGVRIAPGWTYVWAASYFSDLYGETPLSAGTSIPVGGIYALGLQFTVPPVGNADGVRIYRRQADGPFTLNAEFRRGSVPGTYWDVLAQGEQGGAYPVTPLRAGVGIGFTVGASPEAGVLARRIYRTKANGSEYYLVGEIQNNTPNVAFFDQAFDANLTTRNLPGNGLAGRQAFLSAIPTGPAGTIGRRIYRRQANSANYFLVGELKDNSSATWTDNVPDTALTISMPGINRAGSRYFNTFQPVVQVPPGPAGVIARRVYRTTANGAIARLVAELPDNTTASFLDNVPDDALGAISLPPVSTAGGEQHLLSTLPIGPAGTIARRIYRTVASGPVFRLVGQVNDNLTASYLDAVADRDLGTNAPLVATAGASAVRLSGIAIGPPEVTRRLIYRTIANQNDLRYVGTITNNAETTFLDDRADNDLGAGPQATSTIGAFAGDLSLALDTVAGFPPAGWVDVDGQIVSYTGISGTTLTGIPPMRAAGITRVGSVATLTVPSGHGYLTGDTVLVVGAVQPEYGGAHVVTVLSPTTATYVVNGTPATPATGTIRTGRSGAIGRAVPGGATVHTIPLLTGVGGLTTPRGAEEAVSLFVICNDVAAQAALAAKEGGDGIHEHTLTDTSLDTVAACTARGNAELKLFAWPQVEVTYATHDPLTRSGRPITIDLPSLGMHASLKILEVTLDQIDLANRTYPRCVVRAASTKFSLTDLLRHAVLDL
jgi:hypothetical protein